MFRQTYVVQTIYNRKLETSDTLITIYKTKITSTHNVHHEFHDTMNPVQGGNLRQIIITFNGHHDYII